uniref:SET domain-containing protein n=1 Tax=Ditylenchus dipsaci TaxID=166011 RepID=A0A915DAD3_9BILA
MTFFQFNLSSCREILSTQGFSNVSAAEFIELPQFNEIDRNVVLFKRVARGIESMECQCSQLSLDCGTYQCLNRGSQMECPGKERICEIGGFLDQGKGYGILADEHITTGKLVNEYVGEIISIAEANSRSSQYKQSKERHHYIMGIGNGAAIDATNQGNLSRFINHSCEPNCVVEKWTVNRETRAGIFARRDILESEEVTIDYAFEGFGIFLQKCLCGERTAAASLVVFQKRGNRTATLVLWFQVGLPVYLKYQRNQSRLSH